jgi:hypothetical protein
MKRRHVIAMLAGGALFASAIAWAVHQQASYIVAGRACSASAWPFVVIAIVCVAVLASGVVFSWLALRSRAPDDDPLINPARPRRFIATVGLMGAALFLFAIALQVCAEIMLAPCVP